jgi:hypothetical protein
MVNKQAHDLDHQGTRPATPSPVVTGRHHQAQQARKNYSEPDHDYPSKVVSLGKLPNLTRRPPPATNASFSTASKLEQRNGEKPSYARIAIARPLRLVGHRHHCKECHRNGSDFCPDGPRDVMLFQACDSTPTRKRKDKPAKQVDQSRTGELPPQVMVHPGGCGEVDTLKSLAAA